MSGTFSVSLPMPAYWSYQLAILMMTLHLGLTALAGLTMRFFGDLAHGFQAILCPGFVALGLDVVVRLAVEEEVIVEQDFIEMAGGHFRGFFGELAVFRVGVIEALDSRWSR